MSKLTKILLVAVLAVSIMAVGPLSAIAVPSPSVEPPMTFSRTDMTADYADCVGANVSEITAIGSGFGDGRTLIAGLDTNGRITLADWDGSQFNDWTDSWRHYIEDQFDWQWTKITSIVYFNRDYIVGGTRNVDGTEEAVVAALCGSCYPEGDHEWLFNDSTLSSHQAVTGMSYDADSNKLGITVSGPDAMLIWNDASNYSDSFQLVDNLAMEGATAPISLYGNSYFYSFASTGEIERDNTAAPVKAMTSYPSYWTTGTKTGSVLAAGSSGFDNITPQTLTTPGTGQVFSLDYDWTDNAWLVGVAGDDGIMKLFSDTTVPAITITTPAPATTDLGFPKTITANADGEFVGPYYLVGGTGADGAHLYKWKQASGEFIDFDYLVSDMSKINAVTLDLYYLSGPFANGLAEQSFFVGGDKLLYLTETPMIDVPPVPSGEGSSAECGDGTASVTVPAGAINTDYNVLVEKVASGTPAVPGGLSLLGNSYEFECFDAAGLPVTTFEGNVTITIHYDVADLNGMSEDSLIIYYFDTADSTWKAVTPSVVDKVNHTVTINVNHFTQFGIMATTATALPYTGK
jgi:hypothetical protein